MEKTAKGKTFLQVITANLGGPTIRHDQMEGRDFLVVPMVMLTEGVHEGSNGPLFYPSNELAKTPQVWNHKPIVVYHPSMEGQAISACDPDVLTRRKVGVIMAAKFDEGRLCAEAWLEPSRLKAVDDRVLSALEDGEVTEVSTGLFTEYDLQTGEWEGETYGAIARNLRPDHLAILPDLKGACSIADGAGLLRNEAEEITLSPVEATLLQNFRVVYNEKSHSDVWEALRELLKAAKGETAWMLDVYDDFFTYEVDGRFFKQSYSTNRDGTMAFVDIPLEVTRSTTYRDLNGNVVINLSTGKKEKGMEEKKKLVDALIANEQTKWGEDDRDSLMALEEGMLEKMEASPAPDKPPEKNDDDEGDKKEDVEDDTTKAAAQVETHQAPVTVDAYVKNAPPAIREVLESGLRSHEVEKAKCITVITANDANVFTKEALQEKTLAELRGIARLAREKSDTPPDMNFAGLGEAGDVTANVQEPLAVPVMDFGEKT